MRRWRRWGCLVLALAAAAAAAWPWWGGRVRQAVGWHGNDVFPVTLAMHERLGRRGAEPSVPAPVRHWSRERAAPSQAAVTCAYFRRYSRAALPPPPADGVGPMAVDRAFVEEWLRPRLPDAPILSESDGEETLTSLAAVVAALERLRNQVAGVSRQEVSDRWLPERLVEHAEGLMGQIETATDLRTWFVHPARRWQADGVAPADPAMRACAMAYAAPETASVRVARIGELRGTLRRLGLAGLDPRDDAERPWLVCGVFFEMFSLRRFGFAPEYAGEATALFPVRPAVAREALAARSFNDATVNGGLAALAEALAVYRADGAPGDWLADIAGTLENGERLQWMRKRLAEGEAPDSPEARLGAWLDRWLAKRAEALGRD